VLGFYFLWFPHNRVKVFVFLFPLIMTTFLIPARIVLGVYLIIDNLLPFMLTTAEGSGVAHGAHIGGFLAGLGMALAIDRLPGLQRVKASSSGSSHKRSGSLNIVTDIVRFIDRNDLAHAATRFAELDSSSQRGHFSTADTLAIGEYLLASGAADKALTVFRQLIADRPGDKGLDRAYLGAGRALLHAGGSDTSAWHYFLAAIDLAQTPEIAEDARRYMKVIEKARV